MNKDTSELNGDQENDVDRRGFISASSVAMTGGLAAGYGSLAYVGGRFLYSHDDEGTDWQFVARLDDWEPGASLVYESPAGDTVVVARRGEGNDASDFIALSSICPHLGCQVHWEGQNQRFFCPCHNGAFDPEGRPIAGPPAAANQPLKQFPLKVEKGLLFVKVPLKSVV